MQVTIGDVQTQRFMAQSQVIFKGNLQPTVTWLR